MINALVAADEVLVSLQTDYLAAQCKPFYCSRRRVFNVRS
ncbi:MAG: AAA family ATPase [Chloroflexota bacterium]|nr:AAA family ATPase [Chloroflexota bacterium]